MRALSSRLKIAIALAIGVACALLGRFLSGPAPTVTYEGALLYWLGYAFGLPLIVGLIAAIPKTNRMSRFANAFLWWTVVISVILMLPHLIPASVW